MVPLSLYSHAMNQLHTWTPNYEVGCLISYSFQIYRMGIVTHATILQFLTISDQRSHWSHPNWKSWCKMYPYRWFTKMDSRGHRGKVFVEFNISRRRWWSSLMTMETLALHFLLRSTYSHFPTPANHTQRDFTRDYIYSMHKSVRAPYGMSSHSVGVHFRCTLGTTTKS